jgi:hypothetical protein
MPDERTPLLQNLQNATSGNLHEQFCALTGIPPSNDKDNKFHVSPKTLYGRAKKRYAQARRLHTFMTAASNTLLLCQVVLGATLTALGASESSHVLITVFGVVNTVIAGLVAYLKSRGQPARQRIFRDDLERVVDEIENSEIMWLGIAQGVHGYDDIDIDDKVTVRSEVARLMRCYDKAIRSFAMSNPDNYLMGQTEGGMALRPRAGAGPVGGPGPATAPAGALPPAPAHEDVSGPAVVEDPDQSPASAPIVPPTNGQKPDDHKHDDSKAKAPETDKINEDAPLLTDTNGIQDNAPEDTTTPASEGASSPLAAAGLGQDPSRNNIQIVLEHVDPDASPASSIRGFGKSSDK